MSAFELQQPALVGTESLRGRTARMILVVPNREDISAVQGALPQNAVVSYVGNPMRCPWEALGTGSHVCLWLNNDFPGPMLRDGLGRRLTNMGMKVSYIDVSSLTAEQTPTEVVEAHNGKIAKFLKPLMRAFELPPPEPVPPPTEEELDQMERATRGVQAQEPGTKLAPLPTAADIAAMDLPPKIPLFEGFMHPGAWLIVGRPKIGKSYLILQMAFAVAQGESFLGFKCTRPGAVLYVAGEDDHGRLQQRFESMCELHPPANMHFMTRAELLTAASGKETKFESYLGVWLDEHPDVVLVLIDTETLVRQIWQGQQVAPGFSVTDRAYKEVSGYEELAANRKVVIGLVNHASKRKGVVFDIHELINRANTAFAAASGSMSMADLPDSDPMDTSEHTRLLGIRGKDVQHEEVFAIKMRQEFTTFENLGAYVEVKRKKLDEEVWDAIVELSRQLEADKFLGASEIGEAIGKKPAQVRGCVAQIVKKHRDVRQGMKLTSTRGKKGGYRIDPVAPGGE